MTLNRFRLPLLIGAALLLAACESSTVQQSRWADAQGGVLVDKRQTRVDDLCSQLTLNTVKTPVRVHILDLNSLAGYSWPSGDIYLSSSLVDLLPDDQLRACIAHELGHLINDRHCTGVAALQGQHTVGSGSQEEMAADATAARLLKLNGYSPIALADALQQLHDQYFCPCPRPALLQRIHALETNAH